MFSQGFIGTGDFSLMTAGYRALQTFSVILLLAVGLTGPAFGADEAGNSINSISVEKHKQEPHVEIQTSEPVGFRYTVYDSQDPRRIIVDFRDMALGDVEASIPVKSSPISEIRTSAFDLTSGKLARVEILLTESAAYDVTLEGKLFKVALKEQQTSGSAKAPQSTATDESKEKAETAGAELDSSIQSESTQKPFSVTVASQKSDETDKDIDGRKASKVNDLIIENSLAKIIADGAIEKYRYFTLTGPTRLVVDVYGVNPTFKKRSFSASNGFKQVRIGAYDNKTRFVFDSSKVQLRDFVIDTTDSKLLVDWSEGGQASADLQKNKDMGAPLSVDDVTFSLEDGTSILAVQLSSSGGNVVEPVQDDDLVRFGVENATISRSLRRIIDASVFPSAVRIVTPYTVQVDGGQDVMFAVELKGPVEYEFESENGELLFKVNNGPFAEEPFVEEEQQKVALPDKESKAMSQPSATVAKKSPVRPGAVKADGAFESERQRRDFAERDIEIYDGDYTGQEISLVFDDADIRNILQLIADVSNMNIIATEEVKGSLSIRLIDVPWDQALDIILDIKDLGMVKRGNVVRILPKQKIREMERADLQAAQTREELEPLITEVITVSYTDLGSVTSPAQNILSDRGTITEDARNKQLIVTDVPSRVAEVRKLLSILDTPEKQVVIEARIVEANSSFTRDLGVSWGLSHDAQGTNGAGELDLFNLGLGGSFVIPPPSQGAVGSAGLASGFTFGRVGIDSTTLDLRISALESSGHGKVISTPRVTTLNGKQASISQGTKIPYQSVGDEGTTTEFIDAVLSLDVTPVINPDDSIIMDIQAANSSVGSIVPTGSGSAPAVDTKDAKTQVLVQNGETTVIGGIFVEDEDFAETGVPLLRSIPILGHLFKSTTKSTVRNELLIFITPRIVSRVD